MDIRTKSWHEQFEELVLSLDLPMSKSDNPTKKDHDEFILKSNVNLKKICAFLFKQDSEEDYLLSDIEIIKAIIITRGRLESRLDCFKRNQIKEYAEVAYNAIMFLLMELNFTLTGIRNKIIENRNVH